MNKEYRLYYNAQGIIYRGDKVDIDLREEESYIVVDKDIYLDQNSYRIENQQLVRIQHDIPIARGFRFVKSNQGIRVVKNHIALPLSAEEQYHDVEYYEYTNN